MVNWKAWFRMSSFINAIENQKMKRARFLVCVFCGNFNQKSQSTVLLLSHPKEGIFKVWKIILSILLIYCCVSSSKLYGLRQPIHFLPHSGLWVRIPEWLAGCICLWVSCNIAVRYLKGMLPSGCLIKAAGSASGWPSHAYKSIFGRRFQLFLGGLFLGCQISSWHGGWLFLGNNSRQKGRSHSVLFDLAILYK